MTLSFMLSTTSNTTGAPVAFTVRIAAVTSSGPILQSRARKAVVRLGVLMRSNEESLGRQKQRLLTFPKLNSVCPAALCQPRGRCARIKEAVICRSQSLKLRRPVLRRFVYVVIVENIGTDTYVKSA